MDWDGNFSYDSPPTDTAPATEEELTVLEAMDQLAKLLAEHLGQGVHGGLALEVHTLLARGQRCDTRVRYLRGVGGRMWEER